MHVVSYVINAFLPKKKNQFDNNTFYTFLFLHDYHHIQHIKFSQKSNLQKNSFGKYNDCHSRFQLYI